MFAGVTIVTCRVLIVVRLAMCSDCIVGVSKRLRRRASTFWFWSLGKSFWLVAWSEDPPEHDFKGTGFVLLLLRVFLVGYILVRVVK